MIDRIKDFIREHKLIFTGVILYIIVFIVSSFISPWQTGDISFSDIDKSLADADNEIKFNVKFMFYGIYELLEMLIYASSDAFAENGAVFFLSLCALFTYLSCISFLFIKPDEMENKIEKAVVGYLYDNIFSYIACIIAYYAFTPAYEKIIPIYRSHNFIIMLLFIFIIAFPGLIQFFKMLAYIGCSIGIVKITGLINNALDDKRILASVLSFIVALALIILLNVIIEKIMERVYELSIESSVTGGILLGYLIVKIVKFILISAVIIAISSVIIGIMIKLNE